MVETIISALKTLRAPLQQGEYDLHTLAMNCLTAHGIPCQHEVKLASRCRIDIMVGSVGIEMKRGKPNRTQLLAQLARYAACEQVSALIVVAERSVSLPRAILGKPVYVICLNRLWGIAL